jgi:anti-sigma B factor antagonist
MLTVPMARCESSPTEGTAVPMSDPDGDFRLEVSTDRDRALVRPIGELDLATAEGVGARVAGLLDRKFAEVVIDLRGVTFLDSTGLRMLVTTHNRARESGARTWVILARPEIRELLEMTGVLEYLEIAEDGDGDGSSYDLLDRP